MSRSRGNSLVQSIATHVTWDTNEVPSLQDDQELLRKLKAINAKNEVEKPLIEQPSITDDGRYQKYEQYLADLDSRANEYQAAIKLTQTIDEQLGTTLEKFSAVSLQTQDFMSSTQKLFDEFNERVRLHQSVTDYLAYFEALDPIVRGLHHYSSPSVVKKDSFKSRMVRIDASLLFLDEHKDFKDADAYRIKFKQCMVRCCSLMAQYLINSLRGIYREIAKSIDAKYNSATREALLYNKFSSIAADFYSVSKELASRSSSKSSRRYREELVNILHDCYNEYYNTRSKLLGPFLSDQLANCNTESGSTLVKDVQDNLLFFSQLCQNEYHLIIQFFPEEEGSVDFNEWLFRLCEPLHDRMRERTLKESDVAALCDSVTLLNKYYQFEEGSDEYEAQFKNIKLDKIFEPLLQDIQHRLIFRVQIYVEKMIAGYKPTKDVFMINHRKESSQKTDNEEDIVNSFMQSLSGSEEDVEEMRSCYPPVLRAVALLSRIYQMVNSSIFDVLAHHIVHDCIESLRSALQTAITADDSLDIKLSYLKNLLILRKQVQNFDIHYVCNETYVDFSGLTDFLRSLAKGTLASRKSSVLSLAREGAPKVVNNMVDARSELVIELRNAIKAFTESAAHEVIGEYLNKSDQMLTNNLELRQNVEKLLPRLHHQMCIFIKDEEIRTHLIDAIQELVTRAYTSFYEDVAEQANKGIIEKGKLSELMYVDVFSDFINNVASSLERGDD